MMRDWRFGVMMLKVRADGERGMLNLRFLLASLASTLLHMQSQIAELRRVVMGSALTICYGTVMEKRADLHLSRML